MCIIFEWQVKYAYTEPTITVRAKGNKMDSNTDSLNYLCKEADKALMHLMAEGVDAQSAKAIILSNLKKHLYNDNNKLLPVADDLCKINKQ